MKPLVGIFKSEKFKDYNTENIYMKLPMNSMTKNNGVLLENLHICKRNNGDPPPIQVKVFDKFKR